VGVARQATSCSSADPLELTGKLPLCLRHEGIRLSASAGHDLRIDFTRRGLQNAQCERCKVLNEGGGSAEMHEDALVMLDLAVKGAGESPYEEPERVRDLLYAMAQVARKRRDGALGTSLEEAFGALGIDYRTAIARAPPPGSGSSTRSPRPTG
jgi:hypothetical protein